MKRAFVSTSFYVLGRQLGMAGADVEARRHMNNPGNKDALPVARTVYRLCMLTDCQVYLDCGATIIGKSRSRAFHEAFESDADAWISCDDDVEVETDTAASLIEVLDEPTPRIVIVPCMMRVPEHVNPSLNVHLPMVRVERYAAGARLVALPRGEGGGFGMVGMNRAAMRAIVEQPGMEKNFFTDHDGRRKLAVFHDILENGIWYGEDVSFFRRVPANVTVEALLVGTSTHAGIRCHLESL
jgi:hypothetical protein